MGIVINISILQWIVEVAVYIFCLFYMFFVAGLNSDLDRFFMLFLAGFTSIVLPAFYLNGDIEFRTDLARNGYLNALKNALFLKWIDCILLFCIWKCIINDHFLIEIQKKTYKNTSNFKPCGVCHPSNFKWFPVLIKIKILLNTPKDFTQHVWFF